MTETKHCETCKFWGKPDESAGEFRTCTAVAHDAIGLVDPWWEPVLDGGDCDEDEKSEVLEFRAAHRAVVQDERGSHAALMTRGDFGCVLHEPGTGGVTS